MDATEVCRRAISELILALIGRARTDATVAARLLDIASGLAERIPSKYGLGNATFYDYLFGFETRARQYRAPFLKRLRGVAPLRRGEGLRPLVRDHVDHILNVIRRLGFDLSDRACEAVHLPSSSAVLGGDPASWTASLKAACVIVESQPLLEGRLAEPAETPVPHPEWRLLRCTKLVNSVWRKLERGRAVAVTGMSGVGKSVLAAQVVTADRAATVKVVRINARHELRNVEDGRRPTIEDYSSLWARCLAEIARALRPDAIMGPPRPKAVRAFVDDSRRAWEQLWRRSNDSERAILDKLGFDPGGRVNWGDFIDALATHGSAIRLRSLLEDFASILRVAHIGVLLLLDDYVMGPQGHRFLSALIGGAEEVDDTPNGLSLLVTSVDRNCLAPMRRHADFDLDRRVRAIGPRLGEHIVAAWAAHGENGLKASAIAGWVGAFEAKHMADPQVRGAIRRIITKLEGHPLALAALASGWRAEGYADDFWQRAARAVERRFSDAIPTVDPSLYRGRVIEERQENVLHALRFSWSLLGAPDKERYLDLATSPETVTINAELYHQLWSRIARKDDRLDMRRITGHNIIRGFYSRSLLRTSPAGDGYLLHDLHRLMIEQVLRDSNAHSLAQRHADILRMSGLLRDEIFALDEYRDLELSGADARIRLRPPLLPMESDDVTHGRASEERARAAVGDYLIPNLPFHLRGAVRADRREEAVAYLLSAFRYLQALVDLPPRDGDRSDLAAGNVEALQSALQECRHVSVDALRHIIQLLRSTLLGDRWQLASQLVARAPAESNDILPGILHGARAYVQRLVIRPRFAFAFGHLTPVQYQLRQARIRGAAWVNRGSGGPAVAAWSADGTLSVWRLGERAPAAAETMRGLSDMVWEEWITPEFRGPALLVLFDDGTARLWKIGESLQEVRLPRFDRPITHLAWVKGSPTRGDIICRTDDGAIYLVDAKTADAEPTAVATWREPIREIKGIATEEGDLVLCLKRERGAAHAIWNVATRSTFETGPSFVEPELFVEGVPSRIAVLAGSQEGFLRVYDSQTGTEIESRRMYLGADLSDACIVARADGSRRVLGWSAAGPLGIWDLTTAIAVSPTFAVELGPHAKGPQCAAWTDHGVGGGPGILVWAAAYPIQLWEWDSRNARFKGRIGSPADFSSALGAAWVGCRGCSAVMAWFDNGTVTLSEGGADLRTRIAAAHDTSVKGACWINDDPENPQVLSWSGDGVIKVSNARPEDPVRTHARHRAKVNGVSWISRAGKRALMSWSDDSRVELFDPEQGTLLQASWQHDSAVLSALLVESGYDEPAIITTTKLGAVEVFSAEGGTSLVPRPIRHSYMTTGAAVHAGANGPRILTWAWDGAARVWDGESGREVSASTGHAGHATWATWILEGLPTGRPAVLSWSWWGTMRLWDSASGEELFPEIAGNHGLLQSASWIPDLAGTPIIVCTYAERWIRLFDGITGKERYHVMLAGKLRGTEWIDSAPGGPRILCWCDDGWVGLVDPNSGSCLRVNEREPVLPVAAAKWISSSSRPAVLYAQGGALHLVDVAKGKPLGRPMRELAAIVKFVTVGDLDEGTLKVLTVSSGGVLRLWNPIEGNPLGQHFLESFPNVVQPDQTNGTPFALAFGCHDGSVGVFDVGR